MTYPLSLPAASPLITVTNPKDALWIIELHNGDDSRLTHELINYGMKPALDAIERSWRTSWRDARKNKDKNGGKGAVIIVGRRSQDKFFSNGLDFANSSKDPNFFPATFNPLLARMLSFPLPLIACINGHCFAAGMMLALACDYRLMVDGSSRNAWMSMNEIHFGAIWPMSFVGVLRAKIPDMRLQRKIVLEGHRFVPQEALKLGLLDAIVPGNTAQVLEKSIEHADKVSSLAQSGVWGLIKQDLYHDAIELGQRNQRVTNAYIEDTASLVRLARL